MPNPFVESVVKQIEVEFGKLKRIGDGYSLYQIVSNDTLVYFRYSKLSQASKFVMKAFYGLRNEDVIQLHGRKAFICFVWDKPNSPILFPFTEYESYFNQAQPAKDGQFKTMLFFKPTGAELYFANIARFNVEAFYGLETLFNIQRTQLMVPNFSHTQVQTLIGAIGAQKGYQLWYPESDKAKMDYSVLDANTVIGKLPYFRDDINDIISEIDVIWFEKNKPVSFWEVEHSTPIYSGLLRFNDVLLTVAGVDNFNIVANSEREGKFGREINRPTFKQNRLVDKVTFVDYSHIYHWFYNLTGKTYETRNEI
jgi:hypothetical protein